MKGQVVLHNEFGEGIVTDVEGRHITVRFSECEKTFVYPDAFTNFLVAKDNAVMTAIKADLKRVEEAELRKQEETALKAASEKLRAYEPPEKKRVGKSQSKAYSRANIAFKCNYCDGGKTKDRIGFHGVCSDKMIRHNIEIQHHVWCSTDECLCHRYYDGKMSRRDLEEFMNQNSNNGFVCYESAMLRDWHAAAGIVQTGDNKGKPMRLMRVQPNSLAVLTTREPGATDDKRFVFAVFLVDETYEGDNRDEGYVTTNSEYKIQMRPNEAQRVKFWDYYFNPNAPELVKFGSGLHRYLSDIQAAQILQDVAAIKVGTSDESLSLRFFQHFCRINGIDKSSIPPPCGALKK